MAEDQQYRETMDKARDARPANAPEKPDSPPDLVRPTWAYSARRAWSEFTKDECPDLAAGLTYFAALSMMPGLTAATRMPSSTTSRASPTVSVSMAPLVAA